MRIRAGHLAGVVALAAIGFARDASAHGTIPNSHLVEVRPGTPSELWMEASFGLAVSNDSGAHWDYICEEGVGYQSQAVIRVTPTGRVFVANFDGLFASDDHGCSWSKNPLFEGLSPTDVWLLPERADTVFVTTARYQSQNGVFRSTNGGNSFQPTSLKSDTLFFSAVRTAPSNPDRVYVSAWWQVDTPAMKLFRSDDEGTSFDEIDHTSLPSGPGTFYVWAVDPMNPDVLYASLTQSQSPWHTLILRSSDAGESFTSVLETDGTINSVQVSPDSQTVWVGTSTGFFRSTDAGSSFSQLSSPQKNVCVAQSGSTLYLCGSQLKDGFALATSEDQGTTVMPSLNLVDIRGPLQCPEGTPTHDVCTPLWPAVQESFQQLAQPDGGTPADGGTSQDPPATGCGCGETNGAALWLAGMVIAVVLAGRRSFRC